MKNDRIIIKGAKEHNLKSVNLELEKDKLIVFTGVSGSGKSSMAFDTIYTEGQRRYVESLSNYTKQFLGVMKKPKIDSIEGLSPAISIEQKTSSSNPRSTVGTVTEIFDFVRMLFARTGTQYCHKCGREVSTQTIDEIVTDILDYLETKSKFLVIAPYIEKQKGNLQNALDFLKSSGFHRIIIDDKEYTFDDEIEVDAHKFHKLYVIVDRLVKRDDIKSRLSDSVETALGLANGDLIIRNLKSEEDKLYSENNYCQHCKISFPELSPNSFSFNTPTGMCPTCHGLGFLKMIDINKLVPYPQKSIVDGAIPSLGVKGQYSFEKVLKKLTKLGVDPKTPVEKFPKKILNNILYGSDRIKSVMYISKLQLQNINKRKEGIVTQMERRYRETASDYSRAYYESFMSDSICQDCGGKRLRAESSAVKIGSYTINDMCAMGIRDLLEVIKELPKVLSEKDNFIAKDLIKELIERLSFLDSVGLNYLTLDRAAGTLSGGEAQRIRLASQIASGLTGVIYVLDEPSIGLHQKDNKRLLDNFIKLRDKGNTVIVVEHDRETIEEADTIVDFGPNAGIFGGEIIYNGSYKDLEQKTTKTADYIFRNKNITIEQADSEDYGNIVIEGVKTNNLKNVTAKFPLNKISVVTGVSGAGKSSLVMDTLFDALKNIAKNQNDLTDNSNESISKSSFQNIYFEDKKGEIVDEPKPRLIKIDQSPIGRTPRSNPITYIGAFELIRDIMASTKLSRMRGYTKSRFSFNVKGGRCEKCRGSGVVKIEMHFLADVYVECDVCKGQRYNSETLEVKFKDKTINDILNMDIQEAYSFFENVPKLKAKLGTLMDVGMNYVKLGQPSTTLSGGEAQRIKLAKELSRARKEGTIYIMDEPTTGLHFHDIQHLMNVLSELRKSKSTVIIIEHNMDVIVNADHLIDVGPDGGPKGGHIIYSGSVADIGKIKGSYTGVEVKKELKQRGK